MASSFFSVFESIINFEIFEIFYQLIEFYFFNFFKKEQELRNKNEFVQWLHYISNVKLRIESLLWFENKSYSFNWKNDKVWKKIQIFFAKIIKIFSNYSDFKHWIIKTKKTKELIKKKTLKKTKNLSQFFEKSFESAIKSIKFL